jgi:hypothetical protein
MGHHNPLQALAAGLFLLLAACAGASNEPAIIGSVLLLDHDGGHYGIVGDDGQRYEPIDLPPEFRVDGMRISFKPRLIGEIGDWGDRTELTDIEEVDIPAPGRRLVVDGTIRFVDLEGGFFGILGDDGGDYDPIDLPVAFAADGLRVSIEARVRSDLVSSHLWGKLIEIDEIIALP